MGEYGITLAFKNNQTMVVREKEKGWIQSKKEEVGIGEIFKAGEFNAILLRQGWDHRLAQKRNTVKIRSSKFLFSHN